MEIANLLEFLELVGCLKHTKRTGWLLKEVADCETISGHMYRMAMMTFFLNRKDKNLDRNKCLQMALVHDLAESIVGDITPYCGISVEDKHRMEAEAMKKIAALLGDQGEDVQELFDEYEEGKSEEAKFVKELDRFDLLMQAYQYEKRDNIPGKLQEFFDAAEGKFNHSLIKQLAEEVNVRRDKFVKNVKGESSEETDSIEGSYSSIEVDSSEECNNSKENKCNGEAHSK